MNINRVLYNPSEKAFIFFTIRHIIAIKSNYVNANDVTIVSRAQNSGPEVYRTLYYNIILAARLKLET